MSFVGVSLDGREGQVEPALLHLARSITTAQDLTCVGVTRCRTMSSRSSPNTDPTAAPEARVTRGCKVGGIPPHLVTLRDRLATFSWWPGLGDAGEYHADDAGAFRRPKSSEFPDYQA